MKKIFLLFSIIFSGISWGEAQISFQAIPQKKEVGINEPIRIQFILTIKNKDVKSVGVIKLPAFTNVQIIGRHVIQNQSYDSDGAVIEYGEEIGLRAVKVGNVKIGAATVIVDGKTYNTDPLTITVINAPEPDDKTIPSSRMGEAFLALKVSERNPYQSEGVIARLKFYTKRIELLNSMTRLEPPNFQGLLVQPIKERNNTYEQEVINGEVYLCRTIASYVMFPSRPGVTNINPFTLTLTIPDGFFDDQEIYVKSAPVALQVKKLPDNAPSDFYGVVGDYTMKVVPNKRELKTEEAATVHIEVSGKGNIGLVKVPELVVPEGIEQFIPKSKLESLPTSEGMMGKASTSTVLVPHKGGKFNIDVKPFSFFDPEEGKFKKISIEPVTLNVKGDSVATKKDSSNTTAIDDSKKSESYIPDLKVENVISDVLSGKKEKSNKALLYIIAAVVVITTGVVYFGFRKKKKSDQEKSEEDIPEEKTNKLHSLFKEPEKKDFAAELFQLKKIGENKNEFYTLLESILRQSIYQNLGISPTQFVTSGEIEEKLGNKFGDEFSEECKNLLLKSQIERYSSMSDKDSLDSVYLKAEELIKKLQ